MLTLSFFFWQQKKNETKRRLPAPVPKLKFSPFSWKRRKLASLKQRLFLNGKAWKFLYASPLNAGISWRNIASLVAHICVILTIVGRKNLNTSTKLTLWITLRVWSTFDPWGRRKFTQKHKISEKYLIRYFDYHTFSLHLQQFLAIVLAGRTF